MQKRTLITIIIFLFILAIAGWFIISQKTATVGELPSTEGVSEGGFFSNLFPFGTSDPKGSDDRPVINDSPRPGEGLISGEGDGIKLQQLTAESISGATSLTNQIGTTTSTVNVRYVEKTTGHIYETNLDSLEKTRLTNTTIPGIQKVTWHKDAEQFVFRYLDKENVIKSFVGEIIYDTSTSTDEVKVGSVDGTFTQVELKDVVLSYDGDTLLYVAPYNSGIRVAHSDFTRTFLDEIFKSLYNEWLINWIEKNTLTLATKPSAEVGGYLYFVDVKTGAFDKILGDISGLTALVSPDLLNVIYSESLDGSFITNSFDVSTRKAEKLTISTLPEKCVWSKTRDGVVYCGVPKTIEAGYYPDSWYQGLTLFSDDIWEIDVKRNVVQIIVTPFDLIKNEIDAVDLFLDENESYLFFTNKKDSTLWSLQLDTGS